MQTPSPKSILQPSSLLRRLGAILYDSLLLSAILFAATALVLPLTGGVAIEAGNPLFSGYLFLICLCFYGWFWTHGGQTVGMKTWRFRLVDINGIPPGYPVAFKRLLIALITNGLLLAGLLWRYIDRDNLTLYDRLSGTRLVMLPASS